MDRLIDFERDTVEILLLDSRVQQVVGLARRYPKWTVSEIVTHLRTRRFNPKSRKKRDILTYKQASVVLQRLNLATPRQRNLVLQAGAVAFIDYTMADLRALLSDKYVQELLSVAESHSSWEVSEIVSQICTGERTYTTTLLCAYKQAEMIFRRLTQLLDQQVTVPVLSSAETGKRSRSFLSLFPELVYFLAHRQA